MKTLQNGQKPSDEGPVTEDDLDSGQWFILAERIPPFLEATGEIGFRTQKTDFLTRNFTFELVFTLTENDAEVAVGLCDGRGVYHGKYEHVDLLIHGPVAPRAMANQVHIALPYGGA